VVPEGIIFQSGTAYKQLRKLLVDDFLIAVISLPGGVFQPYSGVKTSILVLDKRLAKRTESVLFVKIESDGFSLGAQRREIAQNDLETAKPHLAAWRTALEQGIPFEASGWGNLSVVEKSKIAATGDYNLNSDRYRDNLSRVSQHPIVPLGDICEVIAGQSPEGQYYNEDGDGMPFYQGKTEFTEMYLDKPRKWTTQTTKIAIKNDILMSVRAPVGPVNLCLAKCCIGRGLAAIRPKDKNEILFLYIFHVLKAIEDKICGNSGAVFASINKKEIEEIEIPFPPIDVQREIVAELEGYQKIIDGARQVVESYKPRIPISPDWPVVELGTIADFKNGMNFTKESVGETIKIVGVGNFKNHLHLNPEGLEKVTVDTILDASALLACGDILFVRSNGNKELVGRSMIVPKLDERVTFSGFTIRCRILKSLNPMFLAILLKTDTFRKKLNSVGMGANISNLSQGMLKELQVPVPDLATQQAIVAEIEAEQRLVDGNKELIRRFEEKIKATINRVWGEAV
jgi:type I restriction enzyme M protein